MTSGRKLHAAQTTAKYPWGNALDPARTHTRLRPTAAVTADVPAGDNPYGVSDMVGNAREWTADLNEGLVDVLGGGFLNAGERTFECGHRDRPYDRRQGKIGIASRALDGKGSDFTVRPCVTSFPARSQRASTVPGPTPRRFPCHRASNWQPTPSPEAAAHRKIELIRPVSNLPAVLITWPAAPNITDANPRAIANLAATASPGLGRS